MKFIVTRTSLFGDGKPCDGAHIEEVCYKNKFQKTDMIHKAWVIEFSTIEEMMDFINKNEGRAVIHSSETEYETKDFPEIEIYDGWRE